MNADSIERDQPIKSNVSTAIIAAYCTTAAIALMLFSLYLTWILQWQGPFRDLWEFVGDIEKQFRGEWSLAYLLDAYGGAHRIFLPKLLFFADSYWFDGSNQLTIATALGCQFIYLFLLWRALRACTLLSTADCLISISLFAAALFSTTQISNFLYAMDVQWFMSNLFGLLSLYLAVFSRQTPLRWLLAVLLGIVAALCNFTGLMALPLIALLLCLQRQRHKTDAICLLLIGGFCAWYINNGKSHTNIVIGSLLISPDLRSMLDVLIPTLSNMAIYVLRYLASPLSREWPIAGYCLSLSGIAITLYYWMRFIKDRHSLQHWQQLCLCLSTYIIISACFTALGRIIYPNSAVAERYQTLVLPWLPALFGLTWPNWRNLRFAAVILLLWTAIFFVYLLPAQHSSAHDMVILSSRVHLAHTAARSGVLELPNVQATLSHPLIKNNINAVKNNDAFLRSQQLGYFQTLPAFALGKTIDNSDKLPLCNGSISLQLDEENNSMIISGQLTGKDDAFLNDLLLVQNNTVVGLGITTGSDDSFLPVPQQDHSQWHFRTYANSKNLLSDAAITLLGVHANTVQCQYALPIR